MIEAWRGVVRRYILLFSLPTHGYFCPGAVLDDLEATRISRHLYSITHKVNTLHDSRAFGLNIAILVCRDKRKTDEKR